MLLNKSIIAQFKRQYKLITLIVFCDYFGCCFNFGVVSWAEFVRSPHSKSIRLVGIQFVNVHLSLFKWKIGGKKEKKKNEMYCTNKEIKTIQLIFFLGLQ